MQRLIYLGIAVLGGTLAVASWIDGGYEVNRALEAYRAECHAASARDAVAVERTFRTIYQHARMIARMPGVRSIDREARNFDENARGATLEIYNNLASDVAVSALYIVPIEPAGDDRPEARESARESVRTPAPIVSFGESVPHEPPPREDDETAAVAWSAESGPGRFSGWPIIDEQLEWLRANFPKESSIAGLSYPAIAGPEVVAWEPDPDEPVGRREYDRPSVVYSVPFYGQNGELRGCVSAVIRTAQLARLLTADGVRLENRAAGYVVTRPGSEAAGGTEERSLYTETIDIRVSDGHGAWTLAASAPDEKFWARLDVRSARAMALWGYWGSGLITVALAGVAWFARRERLASVRREKELAAKVKERTADIESTAAQMEVLLLQARAATEAKSGFLANMSHEIRTPMTSIVGYADLLLNPEQTPEERADAVHTIRRNAEHLLAIINDILDISKIEAGRMTVETIPTRPVQVVEEVYSLMQVRARAKGIDLKVQRLTPLPEQIATDPTRLRQILVNLVGNAIKFTEAGTVTLTAEMIPSGRVMRFSVTDTGIGMTSDQMARLFSAFTQADATMTRRFGGTGLGLTISKRLAEMLGGDITVQSEAGKGSTFVLTIATGPVEDVPMRGRAIDGVAAVLLGLDHTSLDRAPVVATGSRSTMTETGPGAATSARSQAAASVATGVLLGRRILLAEDGPDNQRLIAHHLKKAGAEVEVAENGQIAMEMALAAGPRAFDVVLMDMQMPVMDGYTATSLLRSKGYRGAIVALTAHAMTGDREKCVGAGCNDYLTKPIDRARLIAACAEWAGRTKEMAKSQ